MGILEVGSILAVLTVLGVVIHNQVRLARGRTDQDLDAGPLVVLNNARVSALQVVVSSLITQMSARDDLRPLLERARFESHQVNKEAFNIASDDQAGAAVALEIDVLFRDVRDEG